MLTPSDKTEVRFTTKGQVVIPAKIRRKYHITEGTQAVVEETAEGILLRPITTWAIKRARGLAKSNSNGKSTFAQDWAKHKREEIDLEEAKYARLTTRRSR
ncbi:MAG: AbrB/MazE/SpoVT family DNA-binding domain-containing protein [Verrucomicrobiia bacterium]